MNAHRLVLRAASAALVVTAVLGVAAPVVAPPDAGAALICQHSKKKSSLRLRADACTPKEQAVLDTATVGTLAAQVGEMRTGLAMTCPGAPERRLLSATRDVGGLLVTLGYLPTSLCRTLDADLAACEQAFEAGTYGATACVAFHGKCIPCEGELDAAGVCRNVCLQPVTCPGDPARTPSADCEVATTQAACEHAWTATTDFATPTDVVRGTSCWWDVATVPPSCRSCSPAAISLGQCGNTCLAAADLPPCRLGGRTFGDCAVLHNRPVACELTYELSRTGTQTCWYDAGAARCQGCSPFDEAAGRCTNGC